jgi:hypothetical protein
MGARGGGEVRVCEEEGAECIEDCGEEGHGGGWWSAWLGAE